MSAETKIIKQLDTEIRELRKAGYALPDIARRLDMTEEAVHTSLTRELSVYAKRVPYASADYMRLMLERYEEMFREVWPLCHHRKIEGPDGEDIVVPPDERMIQATLKIMDKMNNMVGLTPANIENMVAASMRHESHEVKASLAGTRSESQEDAAEASAKDWTLNMINLIADTGALDAETMAIIHKAINAAEEDESKEPSTDE